jgi:glycosyltransferase involved in cell wall biosynthesis
MNGDIRKKNISYIVITPVRNEENNIEYTINSIVFQTIKPVQWIIVDDGSIDNTYKIVEKYANNYKWITTVKKYTPVTENMETGSVAKAFLYGMKYIEHKDYEFIVKLDGDLSFQPDYFERIFKEFEKNPKLGIASGGCYEYKRDGMLILEKVPIFHTRGASKIYRIECFESIGRMIPQIGWDTIDEIKARMNGWITRNFPELKMIHYRRTGSRGGILRGKIRGGYSAYYIGYHPVYMILRCLYWFPKKPFIIGGLVMLLSYMKCIIYGCDQIQDKKIKNFIKREQIRRIFSIKL